MVPWWQVEHWRSFRHFAASFWRKSRPRSTTAWICFAVTVALGAAGDLGASERAALVPAVKRQRATMPAPVRTWKHIVSVLWAESLRVGRTRRLVFYFRTRTW